MDCIAVNSELFDIVRENMERSGEKMPFSKDAVVFSANLEDTEFKISRLKKITDKEKLLEFAYLALLRRVPDSGAVNIWKSRRWMPNLIYRTFLLSTILASSEFKNNPVKVRKNFISILYKPLRAAVKIKRKLWQLARLAVDCFKRLRRWVLKEITHVAFRSKGKRNLILINDLFTEKQAALLDGFELFNYAYQQKDDTLLKPYYIMNIHSSQYGNVKTQYGKNIIGYDTEHRYRSLMRLYRMFRRTKFVCDGYQVIAALGIDAANAIRNSRYAYYIFTQHGVNFFKEDYINATSYSSFCFDKVMVSNDYEKQLFLTRGCFEQNDIIENGLFRWDKLSPAGKDEGHHQHVIFVYFTHRRYLRRIPDIKSSTYVKTILGLLSDPMLKVLEEKYRCVIKLGLHHSVLETLEDEFDGCVEIVDEDDIAEVKRTADILITDLSSMCFEMWYQRKPVIFLTIPDSAECIRYREWTDIPYPYRGKEEYLPNITKNTEECIALLENYLSNECRLTPAEETFISNSYFYNGDYCKRFYNYLISLHSQEKARYEVPFARKLKFASFSSFDVDGLSTVSPGGRWIVKKHARVGFQLPKTDKPVGIQISGLPMLGHQQHNVKLYIRINGHKVYSGSLTQKRIYKFTFEVPEKWVGKDRYMNIAFKVPKCLRHCDVEPSCRGDGRRLSLQLKTLQLAERDVYFSLDRQFKLMEE